jgi:orotidine-5'-phosphate decarboxylase
MNYMEPIRRIIPAVDKMTFRSALNLIAAIGSSVDVFKVHATVEPQMASNIKEMRREGAKIVWVDFKDFDMPDTVAERAAAAKDAGADWLTVHAHGGAKMVEAAVKNGPPFIIAVTLLSGTTDEMVAELYNPDGITEALRQNRDQITVKLAHWGLRGGAHALVCAPTQVGMLSAMPEFNRMIKIVPGTRSAGVAHNDQKQVDTPFNAIFYGADLLVGGRQITQATDQLAALKAMALEIAPAIEARIAAGTWKEL